MCYICMWYRWTFSVTSPVCHLSSASSLVAPKVLPTLFHSKGPWTETYPCVNKELDLPPNLTQMHPLDCTNRLKIPMLLIWWLLSQPNHQGLLGTPLRENQPQNRKLLQFLKMLGFGQVLLGTSILTMSSGGEGPTVTHTSGSRAPGMVTGKHLSGAQSLN